MLRHFVVVALALFFTPAWSTAQTRPDFSGVWEIDRSQSSATEGVPTTFVITQTPTAVTIEQRANGQQDRVTYPFKATAEVIAGVATRAAAAANEPSPSQPGAASAPIGAKTDGPGGQTGIQATGAEWTDGGLETIAVMVINGKSVTQRTRRTMNSAGTEMTVERILAVQHGYETGDASNASRDVYVKRSSAQTAR